MSDPRRLLDEGANDFEAKLLRAGRRDAPAARNRRRVLAGLGLGSVLSTSVVASAGGSGKFLSSSALGALRWVGGGAVSALAVWAGVQAFAPAPAQLKPSEPSNRPTVAMARPLPAPAPLAPSAPPAQAIVEAPTAAKSSPVARTTVAAAAPERARDSLSAELAALDRARGALSSRDASLALRLLDEYAQRFPKRRLNTEAAVLRIEALAARGDRASAARLGKEFLARQPNGPYARRVSSLIAEPLPSAKAEP